MNQLSFYNDLFITEIRRRLFDESFPRLRKCLSELSESEIWHQTNKNSNSVGNLALHLCGNVRQWIISGLGKEKDERIRDLEFSVERQISTPQLIALIDQIEKDAARIIDQCTIASMMAIHPVQIYQETGIAILIHVVEHFSYHVGQITYYVKYKKDMDIGYYNGDELG